MRTAVIAGATGLIGGYLLERLLAHPAYSSVIVLARRTIAREHPKLDQRVIDFDALPSIELPAGADIFCALGTTIKTAGSQEAFRKVDFTYVHELARAGARAGAARFLVVSSIGASTTSRAFYLRVKGDMEAAVTRERYEAIHIFRPSALMGERKEPRFGERVGVALNRALALLMIGSLSKYRPIEADAVAAGMIGAALSDMRGTHIHTFDEILALARAGTP